MDFQEAIIDFLGIQDVEIKAIHFHKKSRKVRIIARQKQEECFCTSCGLEFDSIKEWHKKEVKAPPMGVYVDVKILFLQLRGNCEACQKSEVAEATWIHPEFKSMSCGFVEVAGRLMEEITCEAVSRILLTDSMTMWRVDQWRMELMARRLELPKNIDVSFLAADEVHFRTIENKNRKGPFAKRYVPEFVTNLVSPRYGKVIANALGRDSGSLEECLLKLSPEQLLSVKKFAVDMHEPFMLVIRTECPNADICVDRFHLAQKVNEAFDKVRRTEFKKAKQANNDFVEGMLEPHRRFILMAREKNLSFTEKKMLDKLRDANKEIHTGMLLVEYFHRALDKATVLSFRKALAAWYLLVRESKLEPFLKLAKTIRRYRKQIEAYILSGLTTAVAEGLNNKIKTLKRMGYGYTNPKSFLRKILQRCGFLNHQHINTDDLFYCVTP
ncbi:MAG: ISL3 family transposase [Pseudobdellovibrionaceae bacterium]